VSDPDGSAEPAAGAPAGGRARAVLEYLATSLVDDPGAVSIEETPGRGGTRLSLSVAHEDMGRVIGRRGRVAQAIRAVVRAAAASEGRDVSVDIVD
jgi:hypothetical protein